MDERVNEEKYEGHCVKLIKMAEMEIAMNGIKNIIAEQDIEQIPKYLLVLECPMCHDGDEWMGIYFDDDKLKRAYDRVSSQLERLRQVDNSYRSYEVAIYEFTNYEDDENKGDSLNVDDEYIDDEYVDYGYGIKPCQAIRRIKTSELDCFN